ncbi:MAG: response regulator [Candidatus Sabulitectum sp.]|nr:response regulator [Candidatus Sabulitectum sp.]
MNRFRSLRFKMGTVIAAGVLIIGGVLIVFSAVTMRKESTTHAEIVATETAEKYSREISAAIERGFDASHFIAGILTNSAPLYSPSPMDRLRANVMLSSILEANSAFTAVYTLWEPNAFDGMDHLLKNTAGHDATGRFIPYWSLDSHGNPVVEPLVNYEVQGEGDYYLIPKNTLRQAIIGPYLYSLLGVETSIISIVSPIIIGDQFVGMAGVDIRTEFMQELVDSADLYDGKAIVSIINGEGIFVAVSGFQELAGESALHEYSEDLDHLDAVVLTYKEGFLDCHVPLEIEGMDIGWSVSIRIPEAEILKQGTVAMWRQIIVGTVLMFLLLVVIVMTAARLSGPILLLNKKALAIAKGDLRETLIKTANDEIGLLNQSITKVVTTSRELTGVVGAVASGDFSVKAQVRSDKDDLSIAVNSMIEKLSETSLDSNRKISYLNNVPAPVFVIDTDFNILFINNAASSMVKLNADQCRGRKCHSIFSNTDCNTKNCATARAMRDGISYTSEASVSLRKGETLPVRYTGAPIYDGDTGNLTGGIEFIVDITDEARITDMARRVSQGDYTVELTERSESDVLTRSLNSMIQTLLETTAENEAQNWLRTGQMKLNDLIRGDIDTAEIAGNVITALAGILEASVGAFYLADDQGLLVLTSSYAFRRRKNLSNSIRVGEGLVGQCALEKKPILLTSVPEDYIVINSGLGETVPDNIIVQPVIHEGLVSGVIELGRIGNFNEVQLKLLELITENVGIAIYGAQARDRLNALLEQTQEQAEELQTQQEELRQTNEELESQTQALEEASEQLQTQQEELRQTNEELEERSEELEKQSSALVDKNRELGISREIIEEKASQLAVSSKYKSEFLANMSHELRTPLNSMLILSGILESDKDNNLTEKQIEFAKTIHSSGSSLLNLINEILDLSKIESGKMELVIEDVSLTRLLADTRRQFLHLAEKSGLEYNLSMVDDDVPETISTDEQRIGQVIKNLLSNAFKFTLEGSISVTIATASEREAMEINTDHAVAIAVSDTGCGIPEEKLQIIFEAFQQADGTTSRKFGGTGLGLSISRELAVLLGGRLTLKSATGKGSTFTLLLPVNFPGKQASEISEPVSEAETDATLEASQKLEEPARIILEKLPQVFDDRRDLKENDRKMLIVEDDVEFARILLNLAREKGYKVLIASEGSVALQMADQYVPDGIILDIGLPGMSGLTVLSRLKENLDTRHIPVHIISGHDRRSDALKGGALGFIRKPVSMDQMNNLFDRLKKIGDNTVRKLLIVEDDPATLKALTELLGNKDIKVTKARNGASALKSLRKSGFDCMILDYNLPDTTAEELIEEIRKDDSIPYVPTIIHTGRELSRETLAELDKYTERVIIKGEKSAERLLDETTLFMHTVEKNLPEEKRKMIHLLHDKESIFKDRTILVVDDDMRNVFALSSVLEEKGFKLVHAKNGAESLEKLDENQDIDLVLMDIMMPVMDGYEAMTKIRAQTRFKDLPMIALTAKAMRGDRAKCIEAGASDYLAKPVDIGKLFSALRVWLYR